MQSSCNPDLADPALDGVGLAGFKSRAKFFYWPKQLAPFYVFYCFTFYFFLSIGWYFGAVVLGLIGCKSLSPSLALPTFSNNNYSNKINVNNSAKSLALPVSISIKYIRSDYLLQNILRNTNL